MLSGSIILSIGTKILWDPTRKVTVMGADSVFPAEQELVSHYETKKGRVH